MSDRIYLGNIKGDTGQGIEVKGYYNTLAELQAAHPTGSAGDAYLVGDSLLYVWSSSSWLNTGSIK